MADLGDKRGSTRGANHLVAHHGCVEDGYKNAGELAGVWEDLQELLFANRHAFLQ